MLWDGSARGADCEGADAGGEHARDRCQDCAGGVARGASPGAWESARPPPPRWRRRRSGADRGRNASVSPSRSSQSILSMQAAILVRVADPPEEKIVFTIGHSTRSHDELLSLLGEAGVRTLVDVRASPSSRRHPQFNRAALTSWLPGAGIGYVPLSQLGGRRAPSPESLNGGWREPGFRGYADYMSSPEFAAGLVRLELLACAQPTAIMCAEAVWWRCHRRLIADALTVRGWRVGHLGIGAGHAIHELPGFAVVKLGIELSYPPSDDAATAAFRSCADG